MEIILDTNENCFLCLQTIPEAKKNKLCLKNICRFLQINISNVLLEGLKGEEGDIDAFNYNLLQNIKCYFSVTLCTPCYGVTKKLSSIIHDLEVAQLQVNYYSEVFQKILETADLKSAATKTTDNSQTADARMVEQLRKEAKQKCFAHNKKALASTTRLPLVRLNKLTKETVAAMTNKSATVASITQITPAIASNDVGVDISHSNNSTVKYEYSESFATVDSPISTEGLMDASSPEINKDGTENPMDLRNQMVAEHAFKVVEKLNSFEEYKNCDIYFTKADPELNPISGGSSKDNTSSQLQLLENHQLRSCSESLNSNPTMSYPVVEQVVVEDWILRPNNQESTESRILEDPLSFKDWNDGVVVKIENCNESFTIHQNLEEIRGDSSPVCVLPERKKLQSTIHTAKTSKGRFPCNHCNKKFPRLNSLRLHMIGIHPEQIFLAFNPGHRSETHFAGSCRQIFQRETMGYINSNKAVPQQCSYCRETRRYKQNYLRHLVYSHTKIIGEKITAFEDKQPPVGATVILPTSKYCSALSERLSSTDWNDGVVVKIETCNENASMKQIPEEEEHVPQKRKMRRQRSVSRRTSPGYVVAEKKKMQNGTEAAKTSKGRFPCTHCKKKFPRPQNVRLHMIGFHPEQLFLSYKSGHRSESQFVNSCRQIFQRETMGYSHNLKKAVPRQCSYCSETRRYKQIYVRHLVYSHSKIIGEKIRAFENEQEQRPPVAEVPKPKKKKKSLACNHCNKKFPQVRNRELHMTSIHPEQIFLAYKPAHISTPQFVNSCRKILESETVRYGYYSKKSQKAVPVNCSYCTQVCTYKQYYRRHLAYSHTKIIGEKIAAFEHDEAQEPPLSVPAKRKKIKSSSHTGKTSKNRCIPRQCNHCDSIFPQVRNLRLHMISRHPDQIFLRYKPAHISASDFRKDSCRQIFERETVGYHHNIHRAKKKTAPRQCAYCTEYHQCKQYYLKHLVYSHTKIMGEKIKAFANGESEIGCGGPLLADVCEDLPVAESENCGTSQQPPVSEKSINIEREVTMDCGQRKRSLPNCVKTQEMESTNHTSTTSKSQFACSHCKSIFTRTRNLHFHMIRVHPEQLFLTVKPAHRSESQFADSCRKILESETVGYSNNWRKTETQQCAYCTEIRVHKRDYLRHLVYSHTEVVKEKIRAFENNVAPVGTAAFPSTSNYCSVLSEPDLTMKWRPEPGNSSQVNFAGQDNPSYPVVVRVEEMDQISCSTEDTCEELLTEASCNDVQVEDIMMKTEDYSKLVPILVDPLLVDEFNNSTTTNVNTSPASISETTDIKYFVDNGFV